MKPRPYIFLSLVFVAAIAPADDSRFKDPINADRPGIANASAVVEKGAFQVELGVERDHSSQKGVDQRDDTLPTLLRYGLTKKLELRLETNSLSRSTTRTPEARERVNGLAPLKIGMKYQFQEGDDETGKPSLGVIAGVSPPSGTRDFRSHHTTGDVELAADIALNKHLSLNPNIGVSIDRDGTDRQFAAALAAVTLTWLPTPLVQPFVDAGVQSPEQKSGKTSVILDAGVAWIVRNDTQLDVAFGWGAAGETSPNFFWTAGVSERF